MIGLILDLDLDFILFFCFSLFLCLDCFSFYVFRLWVFLFLYSVLTC